jgi:predicted TIM-barrel fold metal-dependent hydrolase
MRTIAIEEHFITPMYHDKVGANEYRNFYLSSRSEQLGHDIYAQNMNIGDERLAYMDAAGISMQVLSFGSPGPQAFEADVAVPMSIDANDRLHALVPAEVIAGLEEKRRDPRNPLGMLASEGQVD